MLQSEIENVVSALNVSDEKIRSKGIKSIRSRVANISEFLQEPLTMDEFKRVLLMSIFDTEGDIPTYQLSEADWKVIRQLSDERYSNWDWNYGKSPAFDLRRSKRFSIGTIDVRLNVRRGVIQECKIYGDFFGVGDAADLAQQLIGVRHEYEALHQKLAHLDLQHYFGNIKKDEFIQLLY